MLCAFWPLALCPTKRLGKGYDVPGCLISIHQCLSDSQTPEVASLQQLPHLCQPQWAVNVVKGLFKLADCFQPPYVLHSPCTIVLHASIKSIAPLPKRKHILPVLTIWQWPRLQDGACKLCSRQLSLELLLCKSANKNPLQITFSIHHYTLFEPYKLIRQAGIAVIGSFIFLAEDCQGIEMPTECQEIRIFGAKSARES